jgi:hypothetical protein
MEILCTVSCYVPTPKDMTMSRSKVSPGSGMLGSVAGLREAVPKCGALFRIIGPTIL